MLFSVIVPIYNVERYLDQCVTSVLNQTCRDFELILVDDGSKDNCGKMIDDYREADSRVVALHKPNGGLVSARKFGLKAARGEYVVVLDGDDWLEETALARMEKAIGKYNSDVVCCGHYLSLEEKQKEMAIVSTEMVYIKERLEEEILPSLLLGNRAEKITQNLWAKAFKRQLYAKYQQAVDNRIAMGEDGVVVYSCVCEAKAICFLPECLYNYRVNLDSMTRNKKKQIPWEGALLRIEYLKRHLPLEKYNLCQQLGCYAAHAVYNVILTQLRHRPYREVKKEALQKLTSGDLMKWIKDANYLGSRSEKLAQLALRKRWIWLIKLYSMIR